jgi:hypothetical protein
LEADFGPPIAPATEFQPRQGRHLCRSEAKKIFQLRQERHLPGMANTDTQICPHVVFAVEGRKNAISADHNEERSGWKDTAWLTTTDTSSTRLMADDR